MVRWSISGMEYRIVASSLSEAVANAVSRTFGGKTQLRGSVAVLGEGLEVAVQIFSKPGASSKAVYERVAL